MRQAMVSAARNSHFDRRPLLNCHGPDKPGHDGSGGVLAKMRIAESAATALALAAMLLGSGTAQAQTAVPDNTLPYRHAYENTQSIFDQCGDAARGELFRKVVREKVEHCPVFSDADKAGFRTWAAARSAEYSAQSTQAAAQGPVPATADMIRRCKEFTFTAEFHMMRRLIDRYGRGEASADDVIQEPCQTADH